MLDYELGIGIVTYNRRNHVRRVVESIRKHTTVPYYLVVADDGSTDGTLEYLASENITCVHGPNRGIAWNKNRALYTLREHTSTKTIVLLEDDTEPNAAGWQFPWIRAAELYGYVTYAHPKVRPGILAGAGTPEDPYACLNITSQCAAVATSALDRVGYFDTRFKGYGIEDGEWTTRLRKSGFGIRHVASVEGTVPTNIMLDTGVTTFESATYRNAEEVAHNRQIFSEIRKDPIPRKAWTNEESRSEFLDEITSGIALNSLSLRPAASVELSKAGTSGAAPALRLHPISRVVARAASLMSVEPRTGHYMPVPMAVSLGDYQSPSLMQQLSQWGESGVTPFLQVQPDAAPTIIGLAALSRLPFEGNESLVERLGFRSITMNDLTRSEELALALDFNFDRAMDLFVPVAASQLSPWVPSQSYLDATYLASGQIPVLVSTLESDVAKIGNVGNVGDNFGIHAVEFLSKRKVRPYGLWAERQMPAMLSIGSFIQHARDRAVVWGTGSVTAEPWKAEVGKTGSIFFSVRGPRTREHLLRRFGLAPRISGDPGMLLPEIVARPTAAPDVEVGFILHGLDRADFLARTDGSHFIIENRRSASQLVSDMARCKRIITSSLHGWIFAHALEIPAAVIKITDRIPGGEFKFRDYAQSVGMYDFLGRIDCGGTEMLTERNWYLDVENSPLPQNLDTSALKDSFPFKSI